MPSSLTKKKARDRALCTHWDTRHEADFARFHLSREQVKAAQAALRGYIVLPGDPAYDKDKNQFNPVFNDYHPAVIVYCAIESDVALALQVARAAGLPFTVRSSGHCSAGFSVGTGMVIDVSALNDLYIDAGNLILAVACACPFNKLTAALQAEGLHLPVGECEDVCVAGFVQGGGYGFTSVTFGMNCDNVIDMRVMLADGSIVTASPTVNYDLWWAMRGGTGGSFGVLLSVRYSLRPLDQVFGWALIWPLETEADMQNASGALMALQQDYMRTGPAQMNTQVSLCFQPGIAPDLPPTDMRPYLLVRGLYVGTGADGLAAIAPLQALPGCVTQWTLESSFTDLNYQLLNTPYSMPQFPADSGAPCEDKTSRYVSRDLAPAEWRALLDYYKQTPNQYTYAYLEFYGGAINSYPLENSAFIHRDTVFDAVLDVFWFNEADKPAAVAFLEGWIALLEPMSNGHIYQNYPRLDQPDYAWRYWGEAQAGLYFVKQKYDPDDAFTFAQCVPAPLPPSAGPGPVIELPPALQAALDQPIAYGRARR